MRIIQLLLSKTSTLVIDDIFSSLTIGQRQEILPQLKIAVQKKQALAISDKGSTNY